MQRRRSDEPLTPLPEGKLNAALRDLQRMCARWAGDYAEAVSKCDPDMGDQINRVADNWRPLFAIANVIGEGWPVRARASAEVLAPQENDSTGTLLLADIKAVFESRNTDRLWSTSICDALVEMEGRPWAEWRAGKTAEPGPITKNQLARLLKPFGITPGGNIRFGDKTSKGYKRHQFEEVWQRYLSAEGVSQPAQRHNPTAAGTSATFPSGTPEIDVPDGKCEKSLSPNDCAGVPDEKPPDGQKHGNGAAEPLGLSPRAVAQIAHELGDWAYQHRDPDSGNIVQAQVEAEARRRLLAGGILPEHIPLELERVMAGLFATEAPRTRPSIN